MKKEIRAEVYVGKNGEQIPVESLAPDEREAFACWLKSTYLNELFRGQGRVFLKKEKT